MGIRLIEVTNSIKKTLEQRYTSLFWVKAEMNKLNYYTKTGHCFPELVEKSEGKIIAQIKSILWQGDYNNITRSRGIAFRAHSNNYEMDYLIFIKI